MAELEKEFDLLLMDYEEGTISDDDLVKLRNMMKEHESLRQLYVRHQMIEATINKTDLSSLLMDNFNENETAAVQPFPILKFIYIAAAILVLSGVWLFNSPSVNKPPKLGYLDGNTKNVFVLRNDQKIIGFEKMPLYINDELHTTNSKALFRYSKEETLVMLKPNSKLHITEKAGAKQLWLKEGDIICDVAKQPKGKAMVILTKDAKTTVLGTQFLLSAQNNTKLSVSEGSVKMEDKDGKESVETKAGWTAQTDDQTGIQLKKLNYQTDSVHIKNLVLINSEKEMAVSGFESLKDGDVISLSKTGTKYFNIFVDVDEKQVGGVIFRFTGVSPNGKKIRIFNIERKQSRNKGHEPFYPYHIIGDGGEHWREDEPLSWQAVPGDYTLSVTPYAQKRSQLGEFMEIKFKIVE